MKEKLTTQAGNVNFWRRVQQAYPTQRKSDFLCGDDGTSEFGKFWKQNPIFQKEVIKLAQLFVDDMKPENTMVEPFEENVFKYNVLFNRINSNYEYSDTLIRTKFIDWTINYFSHS